MPRRRIGNAAAQGYGGTLKPLNRIPILCTASILYLFIIGRNLSTKQTLAAACHAGRGECGQVPPWNAIWNATRIAPWHPFSGFCWRYACLPVLTLGMQCLEDTSLIMPPASIRLGRESAPQVQAVKGGLRATRHQAYGGHCPSLQWSCAQMEARKGRYIYPLTRECATDAAGGLPML